MNSLMLWKFLVGIGALMAVAVLASFLFINSLTTNAASRPVSMGVAPTVAERTGVVTSTVDGRSDLYGSVWQAKELARLFDANPGIARFVITGTTNGERLEIVADRNADILERKHWKADGHGTLERWKGDVISRVRNTANGGTFNDTSTGKSLGTFEQI